MVRVNNLLWGPTDGGFESGKEKAGKNENSELKNDHLDYIFKTFLSTHCESRGSLFQVEENRNLLGLKFLNLYYLFLRR